MNDMIEIKLAEDDIILINWNNTNAINVFSRQVQGPSIISPDTKIVVETVVIVDGEEIGRSEIAPKDIIKSIREQILKIADDDSH